MTKELNECSNACLDAHKASLQAMKYCLRRGGPQAEAAHLLRLLECAQLCDTCAEFCFHDSLQAVPVANACARACEKCAQDCDGFEDVELKQCAEICRYAARCCYTVVHAVPA